MKKAIVFKSVMGSTKKYANWLKKEIDTEYFNFQELQGKDIEKYDLLIVMSGTYAGKLPLLTYLEENWQHLQNKKIIAIAVGGAKPGSPESENSYNQIPEKMREKIKYFQLIGQLFLINKGLVKKENLAPVIKYVNSLDAK